MFSEILINRNNLISNLNWIKSQSNGAICLMVKANAYGHGDETVAKIASDYVDYFGVSNQSEAERLKDVTDKPVIVFGGCDDYKKCILQGVEFALFSLSHLRKILQLHKQTGIKPKMHLCVNTGMNRYGIRSLQECKKIIALLCKYNLQLAGLYTHFSTLTTDKKYLEQQIARFEDFRALIPKNWNTIIHVGGGRSLFEKYNVDMHRVGLFAYGYGNENLFPVAKVVSHIVDMVKVKKGEYVGYLCGYKAEQDLLVATIPLGYADGLPRKLSGKLVVKVNGKIARQIGNICMDACMIDVSQIKCQVGDEVVVIDDATEVAEILETTEYEVLTNISNLRGNKKTI